MAKRFVLAFVAFVGLIVPGSMGLALLAAPAKPAPVEPPGCQHALQNASLSVAASRARLHGVTPGASGMQMCKLTRLYFLEVVKARAVTALCERGNQRERALGHYDADVAHINDSIATLCQ